MKQILLITAILLSVLSAVQAQDGFSMKEKEVFKNADFSFYQEEYDLAMGLLEDLVSKHKNYGPLNILLGRCYLELDVYDKDAMRLLEKAFELGEEEALFYLGRAYHRDGQLDKATECYNKYRSIDDRGVSDDEVARQEESIAFAIKSMKNARHILIQGVGNGINTPYDEYVPVVNGESTEMYFTSRRPGNTGGKKDDFGYDFEDVFVSYSDGKAWTEAKRLPEPLNSETHDAVVALSPDGMTMLLYRPAKRSNAGDLYIAEWGTDEWTKPVKWLEELNTTYQETSACFSSDGNTLFFSSTRPGGHGGKDIYRIKRLPTGNWSSALNLGPTINTAFDEDAPFMDVDGETLYFASEGHMTMGGYDIFKTEIVEEGEWTQPKNLGYPVNGFKNDIYLNTNSGGFKGYFSSERPNGEGGQDIYEVEFTDKVESMIILRGYIHDQLGIAQKASITVVRESDGGLHGIYNADSNGKYILSLFPGVAYNVLVEAPGCNPYITTIQHDYNPNREDFVNMPAVIIQSTDH